MRTITIFRNKFDHDSPDWGIMSDLYIDGVLVCQTIEPPRLSKYGCVEAGEYSLVYKYSPSFRRKMYYLDMAKAGSTREGIMFHAGNSRIDTKGCICPGYGGIIDGSFYLTASKVALDIVQRNIANVGYQNVVVKIVDSYDL